MHHLRHLALALIACTLVLLGGLPALSHVVETVDGETYEGKIVIDDDERVVIATTFDGQVSVPRAKVKRVDKLTPPLRDQLKFRADLADIGIPTTPSAANFVLAEFGEGEKGAAAADAFLKSKGIIARRMEGYGLAAHLRISIGDEDACAAVIAALKEFRS